MGPKLQSARKIPSLRNESQKAPYLHHGRYARLAQVLAHCREPPERAALLSELNPLPLSATERDPLIAFPGTLSSPPATEAKCLQAPDHQKAKAP